MSRVFNQIIKIDSGSFAALARDESERRKLVDTLNEQGKLGWRSYHVEQVGNSLLVFMHKPDAG